MLRIKLVLIAGIVLVGALVIRHAVNLDIAGEALKEHPLDGSTAAIPQPLAAAVLTRELPKAHMDVLCLAVDGKDPSTALVEAMQQPGRRVVPASECMRIANEDRGSVHRVSGKPALIVDVRAFRPQKRDADNDGAITGVVEFSAYHHRMSASYKTLEVKQVDGAWQVVRTIKHVAM